MPVTRRRRADGTVDDKRGGSSDRHRRKLWMIGLLPDQPDAAFYGHSWKQGNGVTVPCYNCGTQLTLGPELEADRIIPGDSYARWNIRPSCPPCNKARF